MSPCKVHVFSGIETPYTIEASHWVERDGKAYALEPKNEDDMPEIWKKRTLIPFSIQKKNMFAFLGPYDFFAPDLAA